MAVFLRFVSAFSNAVKTMSLMICLYLTACSSGQNTPPKLLNALRIEQQTNHIVIGYQDGYKLEYIDVDAGNAFRRVSLPTQTGGNRSLELPTAGNRVQTSSDGKWIASCADKSSCTISEKNNPRRRLSIPRKNALTALHWSPDDKFVFLVERGPKWRLPVRCSLEDEWDVSVYDIAEGTSGVFTTVCGGFPYGSLRWYELSRP